ncbi:hypothetical protein OH76DRAFT_622487 [Lentinus brumalis]|uniref:F-box domain-containing protein n=1 Tax=Lentinus brumalis TaxID=2498619 RepID=A0A371D935_9APHY|nr:hypothetical protein OH76DRAFT_622487 [Polyporus brumalis]
MPSRPYEAQSKKENRHKYPRSTLNNPRQHGQQHGLQRAASGTRDVLLSIPSESLTHVTAYLDPPDLLVLARTCKQLHAHVTDDNTWRRAYVHQYLGISPESDLRDEAGDKTLMLRREESSWRKEFILRYKLSRYVMSICTSEKRNFPWDRYMRRRQTCCCNEVGYMRHASIRQLSRTSLGLTKPNLRLGVLSSRGCGVFRGSTPLQQFYATPVHGPMHFITAARLSRRS